MSFIYASALLVLLVNLFFIMTMVIPLCFIFKKAGQVWWYALIPIANIFILTEIAGLPRWFSFFVFLYFFNLPYINIVLLIWLLVLYYFLSKRFGCNTVYTLGLTFLPFIFGPIIAFGKSVYIPLDKKIINQPPVSPQTPQPVVITSESTQIPQSTQTI